MKLNLPKNRNGGQSFQKMAEEMKIMQKRLAAVEDKEYEGTSGGSAVKITVNGKLEVVKVVISPEVLGDADLLPDLIQVASNIAIEKAVSEKEDISQSVTAGLNLDGLF